jgi:glutaredoxin
MTAVVRLVVWTVLSLAPALAQKSKTPDVCPWCKNESELLTKSGLVSHGPIPIGIGDSKALAEKFAGPDWIFAETAHLRWAFSLGFETVDNEDQERVAAELTRMRAIFPKIPEKLKRIDPWLRLHMLALRGEDFYARFQRLLGVTDADFPAERSATGPFVGIGRYLGERDKFEVIIHATRVAHRKHAEEITGAAINDTVRWHYPELHKLIVVLPAEDGDVRRDRWLFPFIAHNLSHTFFSAYKHFSYDPPIWIDEGLALALEKEIEPRSTTNDGDEGTFREAKGPSDWVAAAKKLVASGKAPPLATLMHVQGFGELDPDETIAICSMARFLIAEHPAALARFLGGIKGQLDERGSPSGRDLPGLQRNLLKEIWRWTPADFDEAWKLSALR